MESPAPPHDAEASGQDPTSSPVVAAFMIHPMELADLRRSGAPRRLRAMASLLPDSVLRPVLPWVHPTVADWLHSVRLRDGRDVRVALIASPMLPEQIREDPSAALDMARRGADVARELGAAVFGLGAYWSTVGDKGREVQAAAPDLVVTNGGAYTAATVRSAVPAVVERAGLGRSTTAAVVGANGVVAFGAARLLADRVGRLVLIGRDEERLERSADTLRSRFPDTQIEAGTDLRAARAAALVVTATSSPEPVLTAEHITPGTWIYDVGRPSDVAPDVHALPDVRVVPGGVVRLPGRPTTRLELGYGPGCVPACLAETVVLAAERRDEHRSLGARTRGASLRYFHEAGPRLGFATVVDDPWRAADDAPRVARRDAPRPPAGIEPAV